MVDALLDPDYDLDDRLFHYTSASGLAGILQSNCFWATHFQFLNDSKEFYAARASLEEFTRVTIQARIAAHMVNNGLQLKGGSTLRETAATAAASIISTLYDGVLGEKDGNFVPYVFSAFCCNQEKNEQLFRDGGLLHWATYGSKGGYALQINPHVLYQVVSKRTPNSYLSRKAVYCSGKVIPDGLRNDFEELAVVLRTICQGGAIGGNVSAAIPVFCRIISLLKDAYFEQENEARIVVMRPHAEIQNQIDKVYIRERNSQLIPYIKLFEGMLLNEAGVIEKIIVGPHENNLRRVAALQTFLRANGLDHIEIAVSNVPYLGLVG
jgi:hypothetical protein